MQAINCAIYVPNLIFWLWFVSLRSQNLQPSSPQYGVYVQVFSHTFCPMFYGLLQSSNYSTEHKRILCHTEEPTVLVFADNLQI